MTGPIARILLRYAAAALVAKGVLSQELGYELMYDPAVVSAVEVVAGLALAFVAERWYVVAKRLGLPT